MKSRLAFLLLFMVVFDLEATGTKDKDEQAAKLYHEGKYAEALDIWYSLESSGNTDPNLFFNIGISESMLGHIPESILSFEKARRLRPYDPVIREAVKKERAKIENAVIPVNPFFLNEWYLNFLAMCRPGLWVLLGLICLGLALLKWLMEKGVIKSIRILADGKQGYLYMLIFGIFLVLTGMLAFRQLHRTDEAIVMSACDCRQAASEESPVIRLLNPGEKVRIKDHISDWNKVSLLNLDEGWIKKECLQSIRIGDR